MSHNSEIVTDLWSLKSVEGNLLNFRFRKLASLLSLDSNFVLIFIVCRAFGGRCDRKTRQVFARGEKGLNLVETSVMNLVIIVAPERG